MLHQNWMCKLKIHILDHTREGEVYLSHYLYHWIQFFEHLHVLEFVLFLYNNI